VRVRRRERRASTSEARRFFLDTQDVRAFAADPPPFACGIVTRVVAHPLLSRERPMPRSPEHVAARGERPARSGPRARPAARIAAALLASAGVARADPFPSRGGESGILDVPDAEVIGLGGGMLGGEVRLETAPGARAAAGPSPVAFVVGLGHGFEAGVFGREGGLPGDARPSPLLVGAALKLHLVDAAGALPALAVDAVVDRLDAARLGAARVVASTRRLGPLRLLAFGGLSRPTSGAAAGASAGAAAIVSLPLRVDAVGEALTGPAGALVGGGLRLALSERVALTAGAGWLPREGAVRASFGIGIVSPPPRRRRPAVEVAREEEAKPAEPAPAVAAAAAASPPYADERPHFPLRLERGEPPEASDGRPAADAPAGARPVSAP
jgi:hypothetical protein